MKKKVCYLFGLVFSIGLFLGTMSSCASLPNSSENSSDSSEEINGSEESSGESSSSEEDTSFAIEHYLETLEDGVYEIFEREVIEINSGEDLIFYCNEYEGFTPVDEMIYGESIYDKIIKFYYTRNSYQVSFISNGGSKISSTDVKYEDILPNTSIPNRDGFTFENWYLDEKQTTQFISMPAYAITLYAHYEEETFAYYFEYETNKDGITILGTTSSQKQIHIPEYIGGLSVNNIGRDAFSNCSSLTSITIPDSVTSIGKDAFSDCTSLTNVYYRGEIEDWCNFSFYDYDSNPMYYADHFYMLNESKEWYEVTEIVVPDTVTKIGDYQFFGFDNITSVTIGNGVTSIGKSAFSSCSSLVSVTIGNSVTSIGKSAFSSCSSLTSITIPFIGDGTTNNTHFGYIFGASSYSENDTYIPSSLKEVIISDACTSIGSYAFYNCTSLTSINFPDSVTSIGDYAFSNCTSLTNVYYRGEIEDWCNISFGTLYAYCDSSPMYYADCFYMLNEYNKWYEVAEIVVPDTVTKIGDCQFCGFVNITSVTIGNSVTSIGINAFSDCSSLTSIIIPDSVTSIDIGAFSSCSSLTSITLPFIGDGTKNTTYLIYIFGANSAHWKVDSYIPSSLKEVIISGVCTSIGDSAFYECSSLTSIIIPDSVTSIGSSTFSGCSSLTSIIIPDSVTSIGGSTFYGCSSLKLVTIGNNVPSIGYRAFYNCSSLKSITIPDSVTSIGEEAFYRCFSLKSVTIGNGVTSIGSSAFYYCSSLTSVTIGNSVTSIGFWAFYECDSLTSIIIPDSVTLIGDRAFYYCSSLTSVTIGNSVTSIGEEAFDCYTYLTDVYYTGTIEGWCNISFENSSSNPMDFADHFYMLNESNEWYEVTEIVIPNTVSNIGNYQFYSFKNIISISISNSVTSIGDGAFSGCSSLTSIIIPDSVTSIGNEAFIGCSSLTSVTIGNSVTSIGDLAFFHCDSLTSVTIGNGITSIGERAFDYCNSLNNINFGGTTDAWRKISLGSQWKPSRLKTITCIDGVIYY